VQIQEVFGLQESPTLANGSVSVLLHLLSPSQRPIQVTRDLASFWSDQYVEVAKEMRGRYPKHLWPEDPAGTEATTKTKKRMDREAKERD
jgi:ATP-dependent helicase HrpB